jgi:hypothetical protein
MYYIDFHSQCKIKWPQRNLISWPQKWYQTRTHRWSLICLHTFSNFLKNSIIYSRVAAASGSWMASKPEFRGPLPPRSSGKWPTRPSVVLTTSEVRPRHGTLPEHLAHSWWPDKRVKGRSQVLDLSGPVFTLMNMFISGYQAWLSVKPSFLLQLLLLFRFPSSASFTKLQNL